MDKKNICVKAANVKKKNHSWIMWEKYCLRPLNKMMRKSGSLRAKYKKMKSGTRFWKEL